MKLGEILRAAGTSRAVVPRPVEFVAKGRLDDFRVVKTKVNAVFVFVDEDARQRAVVDAQASIDKRFPGKTVPRSIYLDEIAYHVMFEALREAEPNKDGIYERLATTMDELRSCLVREEATRLLQEYDQYCVEEFPAKLKQDELESLIEEAKTTFLPDLLNKYGFERLVALASSLSNR